MSCTKKRKFTEYNIFDSEKTYDVGEVCLHETKKGRVLKKRDKNCWRSLCVHERIPSNCKECGGSSLCPHSRFRYECKECGGNGFCLHGKKKAQCVECKGAGICPHNRRKYRCKDCGGSGICEHGRSKEICTACHGSQICKHARQKAICRECGGNRLCEHGRQSHHCYDCGSSSICIHRKQKNQCKECGNGNAFCKCGKFKHKDGFCKSCHPDYVETMTGVSKSGCLWIDQLEAELGITIQHSHYNRETKTLIRNEFAAPCLPRSPVDGYHAETKTVFEFHGNDVHGHPEAAKRVEEWRGIGLRQSFEKTEKKMATLRENGFKVIYIWEQEFYIAKKRGGLQSLMSFCHVFDGTLKPQWPVVSFSASNTISPIAEESSSKSISETETAVIQKAATAAKSLKKIITPSVSKFSQTKITLFAKQIKPVK